MILLVERVFPIFLGKAFFMCETYEEKENNFIASLERDIRLSLVGVTRPLQMVSFETDEVFWGIYPKMCPLPVARYNDIINRLQNEGLPLYQVFMRESDFRSLPEGGFQEWKEKKDPSL